MLSCVDKTDARSLTTEEQHLLRVKGVDMVFKKNLSKRSAAKLLGVSRQHLTKWCQSFEEGGYEALKLGRRGRKAVETRLLKPYQCAAIVNIIRDNTPDQMKMPFLLWERVAVRELIQRRFGITIALRTVTDYLKRWGMTAQRPVERAYQQNDKAVAAWLDSEYPSIRARARKEGAQILWGDETGVQNCANVGRSFSPKGKTPVIRKDGKRLRTNMISAVSNKGSVRFMIYDGKMSQQMFMKFLKRLVGGSDRKIYLIVDNLKVHRGGLVRKWLESRSERIELFFIPSYSPELNPDEYLNRDLKRNVNRSSAPRSEHDLKSNLLSFMRMLQKTPSRVIKYFNATHIRYAAT